MSRALKEDVSLKSQDLKPANSARSPLQLSVTPAMEETLVQIVKDDFAAAKAARAKKDYGYTAKGEKLSYDEWFKGLKDLYNSRRIPKDIPWKFCSNRSLRIATSILDLLHSRLFPAVVNEDLLRWRPGETTDVPKVERISKLMYWWVWVRSRQRQFFDDWMKVILGYGDTITETSWVAQPRDTGVTEETPIMGPDGPAMNPDGTPATLKSRVVDLFEKTESRFYMRDQVYLQEGSRDIQTEPVILADTLLYRELEDGEAKGTFANITNLLREKMPYDEAAVKGLTDQEAERIRSIKIRNKPVKILKWYGNFDADGDGFAEDVRIYISVDYDLYLGGMRMSDISKSGRRPLGYCKLESRIDRPAENDGEGVLEKVKELADAVDANFNQLEDSNTLSILRPGFFDPTGDLQAAALKLAPNKIMPVSDPNKNIYFPDMTIQTDKLILSIRLILEFIERLTAASSYVLGKESETVGGSGTATRTNAIVSSAEQRFALPAERLRAGAAQIVGQHLDLLQLNIPPGLENRILGEKGEPIFQQNELTAAGIAGEFDAYLLADPSQGSKQTERDLASMFYSILLQNMIVGSDPAKIYAITADFLKAYGKEDDIIKYLGPAPSSDDIDDPGDENTLMIQGDFTRVQPQIAENHLLHIQKHMELQQSPAFQQIMTLTPALAEQVLLFNQQHIAQHEQMMQTMMALVSKFGGGKPNGPATPNQPGQGQPGSESGGAAGAQGAGAQSGLGVPSSPLGQAMSTKREGKVGSSAGG